MHRFPLQCGLQFIVVAAYHIDHKRKFSMFFDFFGKLDVGVLFVKVVKRTVNFAFVNSGENVITVV